MEGCAKVGFSIKEYGKYLESEILNLYRSVGWTNYTDRPGMLRSAYENSLKILGAYADGQLLGIIRVVGDGCSVILIQDILVSPEYQRKGIGAALVSEILTLYQNVYQKVLLTDNTEKTIQFYRSVGFEMDTDIGCRAFVKMY